MKRLRFRIIAVVFLVITACGSQPMQAIAQPRASQISDAATWLRQIVQIKGMSESKVQLRLHAPGVTSVYFNGQRLLRKTSVDGAVAWDVESLVRPGANCLSLAMARVEAERTVHADMKFASGDNVALNKWKITTTAPPVGWQNTDFNDRDWKPVSTVNATIDFSSTAPTILPWSPKNIASHTANGHLELRDGDHVVLLGGTFIERAQQFGYLEAALTVATGENHVTFRNLGWSADTVFAESRGIFDSPAKGYERMIEHVRAEEPTVILLCYGQNEALSFAKDDSGRQHFQKQLRKLYSDLTASGAEVVFLSPHPFVTLAPPLPDAARWNARLSDYTNAIKTVADDVGALTVDLNQRFQVDMEAQRFRLRSPGDLPLNEGAQLLDLDHPELAAARNAVLTDNGMHWNAKGYSVVAPIAASRIFGLPLDKEAETASVVVEFDSNSIDSPAGEIEDLKGQQGIDRLLTFQWRPKRLTSRPPTFQVILNPENGMQATVMLGSGEQRVVLSSLPADENERQSGGLFFAERANNFERLRQLIVRKNELYFHRWRPQNITYLFGFRKHEQGNNASDIARFDPLIDDLEQRIHDAKLPQWQTVTITVGK